MSGADEHGGPSKLLQVTMGNQRVAVALGHDFALLGHPQAAGDGIGRQRQHGLGRRAAAAPQGAATAVEKSHVDVELGGQPRQSLLGVVELPIGRHIAAVLHAVGITDHAHLVPAQRFEIGPIGPLGEHLAEDAIGPAEIVDRFQQGHDRQRHVLDVLAAAPSRLSQIIASTSLAWWVMLTIKAPNGRAP